MIAMFHIKDPLIIIISTRQDTMTTTVTYRGRIRQLPFRQTHLRAPTPAQGTPLPAPTPAQRTPLPPTPAQPASLKAILHTITKADAQVLDTLSAAIEERRFSLGISKFSKASIYLVRAIDTRVVAYVGSTTRSLKVRWSGHEGFFKVSPHSKWSTYVSEHGGPDNFQIELVEDYPCKSLQELMDRERHFIRALKPVCNVAMRAEQTEEPAFVLETPDDESVDSHRKWSRKHIRPQSSFPESCRSYAYLQEISSDTCMAILEHNKAKQSTPYEVLTACRHIFDEHIVSSHVPFEVRQEIFDKVMRDKVSRRILVNVILWKDRPHIKRLESLYGSHNPFKPSFEDIDGVMDALEKLMSDLGLTSPWDCETVFSSVLLKEKSNAVELLLRKFKTCLSFRPSTAEDRTLNFASNISNICKVVAGTELKSTRFRKWIQSSNGTGPEYCMHTYVLTACPDLQCFLSLYF